MSLNYDTVYRVTTLRNGKPDNSPSFIAVGVKLSEDPKERGEGGNLFVGRMNGVAKDWFTIRGQMSVDTPDRIEIEHSDGGDGTLTQVFEPLTREMFLEMPNLLGFDSLKAGLKTTDDVQNYFRIVMTDDDLEPVPEKVVAESRFIESVTSPKPVAVLVLGSYQFERALGDDVDGFSILKDTSSLDEAIRALSNIIFESEEIDEEVLGALTRADYRSVLVASSDAPEKAAKSFFLLAPKVDAFRLYAPGEPPRDVWTRTGSGPDRISDQEVAETFRERAGVDWTDYLVQEVKDPLDPDFDPNAVFTLSQEAIRLSK